MLAVNGQIATNVVLVEGARVDHRQHVVAARAAWRSRRRNSSAIDATVLAATASGDTAIGIALAFNTIGWASQNVLFNTIDAILGDSLISNALDAERAGRDVRLDLRHRRHRRRRPLDRERHGEEQLNATVSNAADSTASALYGANGKAVGGIIAMNKVAQRGARLVRGRRGDVDGAVERHRRRRGRDLRQREDGLLVGDLERRWRRVLQSEITNFVPFQIPQHRGLSGRRSSASACGSPPARSRTTSPPTTRPPSSRRARRVQLTDDYGAYRLDLEVGQAAPRSPATTSCSRTATAPVAWRTPSTATSARTAASTSAPRTSATRAAGRSSAASPARSTSTRGRRSPTRSTCAPSTTPRSDWLQVGGVEGAVYQWMGPTSIRSRRST